MNPQFQNPRNPAMKPFPLPLTFSPPNWGLNPEEINVIVANLVELRQLNPEEVLNFKIHLQGDWEDLQEDHGRRIQQAFLARNFSVIVEDSAGTMFYDLIRLCAVNLTTSAVSPLGFRSGSRWFCWPEFQGREDAITPGDLVFENVVIERVVRLPDIEALLAANNEFFKNGKIAKDELLEILRNAYGKLGSRPNQGEREQLSASVAGSSNAAVSREPSVEEIHREPSVEEIHEIVTTRLSGFPATIRKKVEDCYARFEAGNVTKDDLLVLMERLLGQSRYTQIVDAAQSFRHPVKRAKRGREDDVA